MTTQIPMGDPGVATFVSEEHGQVDIWTGKPPSISTMERLDGATDLPIYSVVGRDVDGDLQLASAGAAVKASGVLTFSGNAVADETVTIGAKVYTWKAAPAAANEVLVGADAAASAAALIAAINGGAGEGTLFGTDTVPSEEVRASQGGTTSIVEIVALYSGQQGEVASTETMTNAAFGAATLTGGVGGIQPVGILTRAVVTGDAKASIWRDGVWNPKALNWGASFTDAESKRTAFEGAPSPTAIIIQENIYDPTFS